MAGKRPSFKNFFLAFRNHWAELMSGGFSVPFAVLAWRLDDAFAKSIFTLMAIAAFVYAAYRVWAFERRAHNAANARIKELENQYQWALRLGAIDYNLDEKYGLYDVESGTQKLLKRAMGFTLHFQNTLGRPLEYRFKRLAVDGADVDIGNGGEVLGSNIAAIFRTGTVPTALAQKNPEQFRLELEYSYGEPGRLSRCVKKKVLLTILHDQKKTDYGYDLNEETACP